MENSIAKFDFDDMLIVPKVNSEITSRYKDIVLPDMLPLFTAPMDTVVDLNNKDIFLKNRIRVTLPRTITYEQFLANKKETDNDVFVSLGISDVEKHYRTNFKTFHKTAHILIDVANGHMQEIVDLAREIRRLRPDIILMVGNIGNPETYSWYAKNECVNYIRVGIGNGSGCLTTKQSGIGNPMASLIKEVYEEKQNFLKEQKENANFNESLFNEALKKQKIYQKEQKEDISFNVAPPVIDAAKKRKVITEVPAIIADGGMKDYSDIIKAFALGADYVMIGSIFNKAIESSADNYVYGIKISEKIANFFYNKFKKVPIMKHFRGMSTKEAQKAMGKTNFKTSEGVVRFREVEYDLKGWVENFEHYLRNAMSYCNAKTLEDFIGKADICQITKNAYDRFNK
jgi:IMP dehydrogenase/GMP reductase